jgi:hypothetical protein
VQQVAEVIGRIAARGGAPDLRSVLAALVDVRSQAEAVAIEGEVSRLTEDVTERVHAHWRDRLQEVQRRRAWEQAQPGPAPHAAPLDEDGWAHEEEPEWSRLARLRALHEKVGANRASVPKPLGG